MSLCLLIEHLSHHSYLLFADFSLLYFRFLHAIILHKFEVYPLFYHKFDVNFQFIILDSLDFACNFLNFFEAYQSTLIIFRSLAYTFRLVYHIPSRIH